MRTFCTEFKAILVENGEIRTFGGPNIQAPSWQLAQEWCHENAGHLLVTGELIEEIPLNEHGVADFAGKVSYENLN